MASSGSYDRDVLATGGRLVQDEVDTGPVFDLRGDPIPSFSELLQLRGQVFGKRRRGNANVLRWLLGREPTDFRTFVGRDLAGKSRTTK